MPNVYGQNIFDIKNPSRVALSGVPMDNGVSSLFAQTSQVLSNQADKSLAEWQEAVKRQATEEGKLAGTEEGAVPMEMDGTIKSDAYNNAFKQSYLAKTQSEVSTKLIGFADQYPADPEAYAAAARSTVDTLYQEMRKHSVTAADADIFKAKWDLDIQTLGRPIVHRQMEIQADQIRMNNEYEVEAIQAVAYRNSSNFFSNDAKLKQDATINFANGKQALQAKLTQVGPNGMPLYSPTYVEKKLKAYNQQFFVSGVLSRANEMGPEEQATVMSGTYELTLPDGSKTPLLENVGAEDYDRLVVRPLEQSVRHQQAMASQAQANYLASTKKNQDMASYAFMSKLSRPGNQIKPEDIDKSVYAGLISPSDGEKLVKLTMSADSQDNQAVVAEAEMMLAQGEDISRLLVDRADQLSPKTRLKLALDQESGIDKKLAPILSIITDKDPEGIMPRSDDKIAREDLKDLYLQARKTSKTEAEAMEITRKEAVRLQKSSMDETRRTVRIPVMFKEGRDIDTDASYAALRQAYDTGKLTENQFNEEKFKLIQIKADQQKAVEGPEVF